MDNYMFSVPRAMLSQNSVVIDWTPSQTIPNSIVTINENQALQGEFISDLHKTNRARFFYSNALFASAGRNIVSDASLGSSGSEDSYEFHEQFKGRAPICSTSSASASCDLQENLNELAVLAPSINLQEFRTDSSIECSDVINPITVSTVNCVFDEEFGSINSKWCFEKFPAPLELVGKTSLRTPFKPYSSIGCSDPYGWIASNGANISMDYPCGLSKHGHELSLSLATSLSVVICGNNIPDHPLK